MYYSEEVDEVGVDGEVEEAVFEVKLGSPPTYATGSQSVANSWKCHVSIPNALIEAGCFAVGDVSYCGDVIRGWSKRGWLEDSSDRVSKGRTSRHDLCVTFYAHVNHGGVSNVSGAEGVERRIVVQILVRWWK